jgi:2-polyprenyl-3-methyl-5-hydroxy-6-metoxy-1,4-benzoquinol methylase
MKRENFNLTGDKNMEQHLGNLFEGIYSRAELEELQESAELMDTMSKTDCFCKPVGGMEEWAKDKAAHEKPEELCCDWYHGTWQYMRLLNMVAVPRWYPFYKDALCNALREKPNGRVMVSACADLGMLHTLHDAMKATNANPEIIIYDICNTPLKNSQWYAQKHGFNVTCYCENIITSDIEKDSFDLVTTDEFLTVLQDPYKPLIVERWKKILKPGGTLVTTAMIGGPTSPELRDGYYDRTRRLFDRVGDDLFPYHRNSPEKKERLFAQFKHFAQFHTRHMLKDEKQIRGLFSHYEFFSVDRVTTPGECVNPTDSFQIVAKPGT